MSELKKNKKEIKQNKFYNKKEFRNLRKEWYKKLDESGFDDIERIGRLKPTGYYDEYNAILPRADYTIRAKHSFETAAYYNNLRKFSYATRVVSTLQPKQSTIQPKQSTIQPKQSTIQPKQSKYIKLTSNDRIILRLAGNGKTISYISHYLRHSKPGPKPKATTKPGPTGLGYSTFWVHTRLQQLIKLMKTSTYD